MFDVSVIVPCYNRARLIGQTLKSVLGQTHRPAEVIVVDDGSTDDTAEVVAQFPAVRYRRIENSGVCRARNLGVRLARSRWLALCDSDDLWELDKLKTQFRLLAHCPEAAYSFTNFVTFNTAGKATRTKFEDCPAGFWDGLPLLHADGDGFVVAAPLYDRLLAFQPIFPSTVLMTRTFFERVGAFEESLGRMPSEDVEFALRCVQEAPVAVVTRPVANIRKHDANFSGNTLHTALTAVAVLEHAQARHRMARERSTLLEPPLSRQRARALEAAFLAGDLPLVRQLHNRIPSHWRNLRMRLKCLAACVPEPFGSRLCRWLVHLRNAYRVGPLRSADVRHGEPS